MNFRNLLALLGFIIVIPGVWICQGLGILDIPEGVIGAMISVWTMIAMFYFRKKSEGEEKGA